MTFLLENDAFPGRWGPYPVVTTEDGTPTAYHPLHDEHFHSLCGARREAQYIFMEGCKIHEKITTSPEVRILEVGLGLGTNLGLVLERAREAQKKVDYYALEIDDSLAHFLFEKGPFSGTFKRRENTYTPPFLRVHLILGDAPATIKEASIPPVDAIFQDAFSPRKTPSLWKEEFFRNLWTQGKDACVLSSFSSSLSMRKALSSAGWTVFGRKGFGRKKHSTVAFKKRPATMEGNRSLTPWPR